MTWGVIEVEPAKIGPTNQRQVVSLRSDLKYQENPREKLGHELSSRLLEKNKEKSKKKEEQLQKILTPYARQGTAILSQIGSRLMSRHQSSLYPQSALQTPTLTVKQPPAKES